MGDLSFWIPSVQPSIPGRPFVTIENRALKTPIQLKNAWAQGIFHNFLYLIEILWQLFKK
jgi:hypothetical protein